MQADYDPFVMLDRNHSSFCLSHSESAFSWRGSGWFFYSCFNSIFLPLYTWAHDRVTIESVAGWAGVWRAGHAAGVGAAGPLLHKEGAGL